MTAHKGNRYASKPASQRASASIQIRCTRTEKALWQRVAGEGNLSSWARRILNQTAVVNALCVDIAMKKGIRQ